MNTTLTRPSLHTKTTPDDYNLFMAKWYRNRDGFLKPQIKDASAIALQLWDCFSKDQHTILISNGIDNRSREPEMLAKMIVVTVTWSHG